MYMCMYAREDTFFGCVCWKKTSEIITIYHTSAQVPCRSIDRSTCLDDVVRYMPYASASRFYACLSSRFVLRINRLHSYYYWYYRTKLSILINYPLMDVVWIVVPGGVSNTALYFSKIPTHNLRNQKKAYLSSFLLRSWKK